MFYPASRRGGTGTLNTFTSTGLLSAWATFGRSDVVKTQTHRAASGFDATSGIAVTMLYGLCMLGQWVGIRGAHFGTF